MSCGYRHTTPIAWLQAIDGGATISQKMPPYYLGTWGQELFMLPGAPWSTSVERYKRVFVVNEVDDTYVYHIHVEIMARIVYHLDFLLANPDVRIMFGCDSKGKDYITQAGLQHGLQSIRPFLELVGLSEDRLVVHKHVFAEEVYLPMEGGCQDPVYQTWHVLHMRREFMQRVGLQWDAKREIGKKLCKLQCSCSNAQATLNTHAMATIVCDSRIASNRL